MTLHSDIISAAIDEVIFGVAAINARNMSSGIRWQEECRYFKDEGTFILTRLWIPIVLFILQRNYQLLRSSCHYQGASRLPPISEFL